MTTRSVWHTLHDLTDDVPGAQGNPNAADYLQGSSAELTAAATSITVPTPLTQTLYLTEVGDTSVISVNDINQGQIGDCFLLASIGEEALFHPTSIANMIHDNGNGTETVTLHVDQNGGLPNFTSTSFKTLGVTVDNNFSSNSVNLGATQDVVGSQKEIWPQVVEKAFAWINGGYDGIANGGYPVLAMEQLTGNVATYMSPASLTLAALQSAITAGDLITMDTPATGAFSYGLVNNHAYMFESVTGSGSSTMVQLGNPWGFDQPSAIPLTQLASSGIAQVDIGHVG